MKIKLSDFVVSFLVSKKIKHIFLISGGGNIHLIDSVGKNKNISYVCNHHEQACSTAAEAYGRLTGKPGVCFVTTGPGGTNAITGVAGAWLDSIPMVVISGQVRTDTMQSGTGLRQLGDQEINIVDIVRPITKYAKTITDPKDIRFELEKAFNLAQTGRPGPVWLDLPLDIQGALISPDDLKAPQKNVPTKLSQKRSLEKLVAKTISRLVKSKRPVLYIGNGVRLSGASAQLSDLVNLLKIPAQLSYAGYDLLPSNHPYNFGRAHAFGQRAANFIIQNSDFLLSIGARLDLRTIGFTYKAFARGAYKVMVDIDQQEIQKKTLDIDLPVNFDAKDFIEEMTTQLKTKPLQNNFNDWIKYGRSIIQKYPQTQKDFWSEKKYVNPYCFLEILGRGLKEKEVIVLSDGIGPLNCSYQTLEIKKGQRVILNNGCAQMGYGIPAAIGACFANGGKRVVCLEGDGSIQLNIHELQVIKHYNLPIKLFVFTNDGYLSIRNTQKNLFDGRYVASNGVSGVSCPDIVKIAKAYGLPAIKINNHSQMKAKIEQVLRSSGPIVCDINSVRDLVLTPKLMTKKTQDGKFVSPPLEEMSPLLPEDEFKQNMLIPLWEEV